jgi:hypothetical protein
MGAVKEKKGRQVSAISLQPKIGEFPSDLALAPKLRAES